METSRVDGVEAPDHRRTPSYDGLVAGGKKGIYTVMYFTAAKKPLK